MVVISGNIQTPSQTPGDKTGVTVRGPNEICLKNDKVVFFPSVAYICRKLEKTEK